MNLNALGYFSHHCSLKCMFTYIEYRVLAVIIIRNYSSYLHHSSQPFLQKGWPNNSLTYLSPWKPSKSELNSLFLSLLWCTHLSCWTINRMMESASFTKFTFPGLHIVLHQRGILKKKYKKKKKSLPFKK